MEMLRRGAANRFAQAQSQHTRQRRFDELAVISGYETRLDASMLGLDQIKNTGSLPVLPR
ncbi:MAG: hypothetical protein ABI343_00660 [Burkholderiaceae bacterium]